MVSQLSPCSFLLQGNPSLHSDPAILFFLVLGPPESSALTSVLKDVWTELELGIKQAHWWAELAGYVSVCGLFLLSLLCILALGEGAREVAILLWTPSVGLVLGAGTVYIFHMQETKGLCRVQAELQHVLRRERETQNHGSEPHLAPPLAAGGRAEEQ